MSRAWLSALTVLAGLAACHTSVQTPTCDSPARASLDDPNTVALVVDPGPPAAVAAQQVYTNGLFASVTLCVPGTTDCQTIDHLLVDTGSVGVRVLESLLTLPLPAATTDAGLPLAECLPFVDSSTWGPVRIADVHVGQEFASALPIQAIGEELTFTQVPKSCTGTPNNTLEDLGSNGVLGVGLLKQDCGASCATQSAGWYYACKSPVSCSPTPVPVENQVANPVTAFPVDNNGVIIQLPCVPPGGSATVDGVMVFGIGTQANNQLGLANLLTADSRGYVATTFPAGGPNQYTSFLDTGSNALFFLDEITSGIPQCARSTMNRFYCPTSTMNLAAEIYGINGERATAQFNVANASKLPGRSNAFSDFAGTFPGYFDWGLPFFFGRNVFSAIEDQPTPAGPGPYFAF